MIRLYLQIKILDTYWLLKKNCQEVRYQYFRSESVSSFSSDSSDDEDAFIHCN